MFRRRKGDSSDTPAGVCEGRWVRIRARPKSGGPHLLDRTKRPKHKLPNELRHTVFDTQRNPVAWPKSLRLIV